MNGKKERALKSLGKTTSERREKRKYYRKTAAVGEMQKTTGKIKTECEKVRE